MSQVPSVSDQAFEQEVIKSDLPVVVDFWAPWCGPCQALVPTVEALAKKFSGKVKVLKLNTDDNPQTPSQYNIMSIPTLIFFKGGKEVNKSIGFVALPELEEKCNKLLSC